MRKQLCEALQLRACKPNMVFMTGDLGFMALENLAADLGDRFINAGIAEQNMMSVAAGLASRDMEVWAYSIAPFCYARPFEQIRNDIAFHNLPVRLIGNGGGYGYGVMGPTHHAIEDYGVLLTLPHMAVYIPVFDEDVGAVVEKAASDQRPAYLRMGRGEPPKDYSIPEYAPWRQLVAGHGAMVIAVGPLAGTYIAKLAALPEVIRPNLWAISELPLSLNSVPEALFKQLEKAPVICIAEEHVQQGSFGADFVLHCAEQGIRLPPFVHIYAKAHHFSRYGSQQYLRKQSGLDAEALMTILKIEDE
jgi:transketolase